MTQEDIIKELEGMKGDYENLALSHMQQCWEAKGFYDGGETIYKKVADSLQQLLTKIKTND